MADIEQPGSGAHGVMLAYDAAVLDRHHETAEWNHSCPHSGVNSEKTSLLVAHGVGMTTIPDLLLRFADTFRKPTAFMVKENGAWVSISSTDFIFRVQELFFGLLALGIRKGD